MSRTLQFRSSLDIGRIDVLSPVVLRFVNSPSVLWEQELLLEEHEILIEGKHELLKGKWKPLVAAETEN